MSSLPLELLYMVADELGAESWNGNTWSFKTLVQLSLVSRRLRSYIRLFHMFMDVHISSHISANFLRKIMQEDISLGRHVQRICLFRRDTRLHEDCWKARPPSLEAFLTSLPRFSALEMVNQFYSPLMWTDMTLGFHEPLRHLLESRRLTSLVVTNIAGFPESLLIQILETIKHLSLNNVLLDNEPEIDPATLPKTVAPLESLRITGTVRIFYVLLQHHSLSTVRLAHVRRLEVSAFVPPLHRVQAEPAGMLIHAMADTLEELEINAQSYPLVRGSYASYIPVKPDLGILTRLRAVRFTIQAWMCMQDAPGLIALPGLVARVLKEATGTCAARVLHIVALQGLGPLNSLHHLKTIPATEWGELDDLLSRPGFSLLREVVFEVRDQVDWTRKWGLDLRTSLAALIDLKDLFPRWFPLLCSKAGLVIRLKVGDLYALL